MLFGLGTAELTKQFGNAGFEDTAQLADGGTHSGFNMWHWCFLPKGEDGISNEEQHRQAVQATVDFCQKD
jgi:hypothetical protein